MTKKKGIKKWYQSENVGKDEEGENRIRQRPNDISMSKEEKNQTWIEMSTEQQNDFNDK